MESRIKEIKRKLIIKYFFVTEFVTISYCIFLESTGMPKVLGIKFALTLTSILIFSQWFCLTIYGFILAAFRLSKKSKPGMQIIIFVVTLPLAAALGTLLGSHFDGHTPDYPFIWFHIHPRLFFQLSFLGVMLGLIISISFYLDERRLITKARLEEENLKRLANEKKLLITRAQLREEEFKRLANEKKLMESNLRLLQAQIEPHFLFNTLNSVISLLDLDLERGKSMLLSFTQYLRLSLTKYRKKTGSVEKEIEMIEAYLNIFKLRMGDRLQYKIDIQDRIKHLQIPTMLIQPLVENAIKHGLEPEIKGGEITIRTEINEKYLRIEVKDTGPGLHENSRFGDGLSNVKERIEMLYNGDGTFYLDENRPSGLKAVIEVPYETDKSNCS